MHRITESLTELLWEFYSVILVEELPNRNCFGINSVIFLCAMVIQGAVCLIACPVLGTPEVHYIKLFWNKFLKM